MDTKQLVDKFVNGEITEEVFEQEKAKLSPEAQEQLKKDAEAKLPDAVEKLKGVRRGIDKVSEKNQEADAMFTNKLRDENLAAAKEDFYKSMGLVKEEDIQAFEQGFKSDSITVENIKKDMKRHYAATHADDYFSKLEDQKRREQEAEEFTAQNGGSNGSSGGSDNGKKASKEVTDFIQASAKAGRTITVEQAQRAIAIAKNKGRIS